MTIANHKCLSFVSFLVLVSIEKTYLSRFVRNTPLRVVFWTGFSMFGNVMKHCLSFDIFRITVGTTVLRSKYYKEGPVVYQLYTFPTPCVLYPSDLRYCGAVASPRGRPYGWLPNMVSCWIPVTIETLLNLCNSDLFCSHISPISKRTAFI